MTSKPKPIPTTLQELRALFRRYPSAKWTTHIRHSPSGDQHCAIGLLELHGGIDSLHSSHPVFELFAPFAHWGDWSPATPLAAINNGDHPQYKQRTPRARVLAAMDDLIAGNVPAA